MDPAILLTILGALLAVILCYIQMRQARLYRNEGDQLLLEVREVLSHIENAAKRNEDRIESTEITFTAFAERLDDDFQQIRDLIARIEFCPINVAETGDEGYLGGEDKND